MPQRVGDGVYPPRVAVVVRLPDGRIERTLGDTKDHSPELFLGADTILMSSPAESLPLWRPTSGDLRALPTPAGARPVGLTSDGDVVTVTGGIVAAYTWPGAQARWTSSSRSAGWPVISPDGSRLAFLDDLSRLVVLRAGDGAVEGEVELPTARTEAPRLAWESAQEILLADGGPLGVGVLRCSTRACVVLPGGKLLVAS